MKHTLTTLIVGLAVTVIFALSAIDTAAARELFFKLHVDTNAALSDALHKKMLQLNGIVLEQKLKSILLNQTPRGVEVRVDDEDDLKAFKTALANDFADLELKNDGSRDAFLLNFTPQSAENLQAMFVTQARETIANRLRLLDIDAAAVELLENDYLIVKLKDSGNHTDLKSLLSQKAVVEFKTVNAIQSEAALAEKAIAADYEIASTHPLFFGATTDELYVLRKNAVLSGQHIVLAESDYDRHYNTYLVSITFDDEGARRFSEITAENIGRQLAIILDGKVISAPTIQERITGGKAIIAGQFNEQEAVNLAALLGAGSLCAPVTIVEARSIDGGTIQN